VGVIKVGDQIVVRTRALVWGKRYELSDPSVWNSEWNKLGDFVFAWDNVISDQHLTTCVVIAHIKFPDEVSNLNHFHVLLHDGSINRIFDDRERGFWLDVEADSRARTASVSAWLKRYDSFILHNAAARRPGFL
jgi:hypothetical protein